MTTEKETAMRHREVEGFPTLLTVPEVAERLRRTERYVRRLIEERRITYFKVGRSVRITEDDLRAFLNECRVEPSAGRDWTRPWQAA
jgi:excisionase family DNA binding protein